MKNYYLQFYKRKESYLFDEENYFLNLYNGLSHVWDFLDGEIIWQDVSEKIPPITKGNIFVSCWFKNQVLTLYKWAKENPDLFIYVCGPIIFHYDLIIGRELDNFNTMRGNAEDLLFKGKTCKWNIEIPNVDVPIGYSVSLMKGFGCYWGKCNFCKIKGKFTYRELNKIPIMEHPHHKYIWLHTWAMPPNLIKKYYINFPDRNDVTYTTYIRGDKSTIEAYKNVLPKLKVDPKYLGFDVGIEFPSDRMLKYINKGTTTKDYLDFIKLTTENGSRLHFNLIVNWKNTNWSDVLNVEKWLNKLSKITKPNTITANLYPLIIVEGREIWNDYEETEIKWYDTIYRGSCDWNDINIWDVKLGDPILSKEQKEKALKLRELYHDFPFKKLHDWLDKKLY